MVDSDNPIETTPAPVLASEPEPLVKVGCDSATGTIMSTISKSTGSVVVDGVVGGVAGYFVAPSAASRLGFVAGGALATAVAGTLGTLGTIIVGWFQRSKE